MSDKPVTMLGVAKACGFKDVSSIAAANKISYEALRLVHRDDKPRFFHLLHEAARKLHLKQYALINEVSEQCES